MLLLASFRAKKKVGFILAVGLGKKSCTSICPLQTCGDQILAKHTTVVPAIKDLPFCGHLVVSRGGAVSCRGAKCTKNTIRCIQGVVTYDKSAHSREFLVAGTTLSCD